MHITAFAANIENRAFVAEKYAFFKGFIEILENSFVPYFYLSCKFEKIGNVLKTFFFGILLKGRINYFVFLSLVISGKFQALFECAAVKGVTCVQIDVIKVLTPL